MSAIPAIHAILSADAGVTSLVGQRMGPDHFNQDTERPSICYWHISATAYDCMSGGTGMETARIRIETIGDTRAEADAVWLAVNKALTKTNKRGIYGGVAVQSISQGSGCQHLADRPLDGSENWLYRTIQSFDVSYHFYEKV